MSMIGNYLRIDQAALQDLLANPARLTAVIYPDDETEEWTARHLDIDKSWHIIHFLLTGEEWEGEPPLVNAVLGGVTVSDEDVGYGPARYLSPPEVQELSAALRTFSTEDLLARWNQAAIDAAAIYPEGWANSPEDREYIGSYFEQLRSFFAKAAEERQVVLVWLN